MAALVRIPCGPANSPGATHVPFQFIDRRWLRSAHSVQRHRLMRVAAGALHFEAEVSGVQCVAQRGRGFGRALEAEHTFVPGFAGQTIGVLARLDRTFSGSPDRRAVDGFP